LDPTSNDVLSQAKGARRRRRRSQGSGGGLNALLVKGESRKLTGKSRTWSKAQISVLRRKGDIMKASVQPPMKKKHKR